MLAVGDENEDPMKAAPVAFPAAETPAGGVAGNRPSAPLNQVSNHSSVSSGFGSAGSAASPNSSYVTAPNSDDSSGRTGEALTPSRFFR